MNKFFTSIIILAGLLYGQSGVIERGGKLYLPGKIIVKFKPSGKTSLYKNVNIPTSAVKEINKIGVVDVNTTVKPSKNESRFAADLNRTFTLSFNAPFDPEGLAGKLSNLKDVEWAEPYYVYKTTFEPNDPKYIDGTQWYLEKISASQAWDVNMGSEEIIIAINDTGIDWDHPDLADKIWINEDEIPGNGIDDDNNGYIDDIRGWDFGGTEGTPDNNPMEDTPTHGTYVAGFAAAATNNGIGIAAIGYNSKLMAVKTSQENLGKGIIAHGPAGIVYAAENGAKVINCSWGGSPYSQSLQDIINYATSLGTLVVSSADNDDTIEPTYPGAYNNVLCVGGTDAEDIRYSASNYGPTVDVVAPATGVTTGQGMYSTWQDNTYKQNDSGTSLAAPLVAGLAALVFNKFPNYTPLQVAEQIRVNTDFIDDINPGYEHYLGTGRINAYKTLSNDEAVSVRAEEFVYTDLSNGNGVVEAGEQFTLGINFKNYLNHVNNVTVSLESRSPYVTIDQPVFSLSAVEPLSEINNYGNPFHFSVKENIPVNQVVELLLKFNDGEAYSDFQLIRTRFNTTYLTQEGNKISLTITGDGSLGFNDYGPHLNEGDGLIYDDNSNLLYESALIYGTGNNRIMDAAHKVYLEDRGPANNNNNAPNDFVNLTPFHINIPGNIADQQGLTIFNDEGDPNPLGIETHLNSYSFAEDMYSSFIILNYVLYNKSQVEINNLYTGLFFDLDMNVWDDDSVSYDSEGQFALVVDGDPDPANKIDEKIGVALISDTKYGYHALSNDGPFNNINTVPEFNDEDKWTAISSGVTNTSYFGDIAFTVSGGPYSIEPGEFINVAFVIAGSYSVDELRTTVRNAREAYESYIKSEKNIPAEILNFNAELTREEIVIKWTTKNEKNTKSFKLFQNDSLLIDVTAEGSETDSANYIYSAPRPKDGTYTYRLNQVYWDLYEEKVGTLNVTVEKQVPKEYTLYQNFPNPFNTSTIIKFDLPQTDNVNLSLYDLLGRKLLELFDGRLEPDEYQFEFNSEKLGLASGVYIYQVKTAGKTLTKKMMLLK